MESTWTKSDEHRGQPDAENVAASATGHGTKIDQPRLVALTAEARAALGDRAEWLLTRLPFKVGRECRTAPGARLRSEIERRLRRAEPLNDLFLLEASALVFHISREHFTIEEHGGEYTLIDRDSAAGTIVAGRRVGGERRGGRTTLRDGDTIVVGGVNSPYVFRFDAP